MVELETEGELSRGEVANFLRRFADELDDGFDSDIDHVPEAEMTDDELVDAKRITFIVGGDSATVTVPRVVEFEVDIESRSPMFSSKVSQEIELELSWTVESIDEGHEADAIEVE